MSNLLDRWRDLWKKNPKPDVKPAPEPPSAATWVRIGLILRSIPFEKLAPLFISVPVIVFFAVSGFIAWLVLVVKFVVGIFTL
jgi:hypothetical protein